MKVIFLLAFVVLFTWPMLGQQVSSSMKGTITDPTGAVVAGAKCTLENQGTGAQVTVTTDSAGDFVFPNIVRGAYTLTVEAPGFKTLVNKDLQVTASEIRALGRLSLQIGEVRETVNVTAEGVILQTASAEKSGVITNVQIQSIAVKGRDLFALLQTVPGIVDNFSQARETSTPDAIRGTFINGGREDQKNVTIDGVTALDTGSNQTIHFEPNMDSIQELKIMTTNYQAEFGRNSGGTITIITKSGSMNFHGTAYDFYRHESLNANTFFNNRQGRKADGTPNNPKTPYRYRITGFSLGGPVEIPKVYEGLKEKFFFFWSEEWTGMKRDYGTRYTLVPTLAERSGDFSQTFDTNGKFFQIKDPLTGLQFPGNQIPTARINKLGQAVLNFLPKPNWTDPDPIQVYRRNYKESFSGNYPKREDMIRIDANLWPTFQVSWRFVKDKDEMIVPWGTWVTGSNWLLSPTIFGQPGKGQVVRMVKTFSPTLVNEFTFGKSRNHLYFFPQDETKVDRALIGNPPQWFTSDPRDPTKTYMPNVTFSGPRGNYPNISFGNIPYNNWNDIYSFLDNVSKVWRSHSFKAGVYVERTGKFQVGGGNWRGTLNFGRDTNNVQDTADGFSNALAGVLTGYSEATARVDGDWWFWNVEWYVQDNWKVTKRLTLDYGLRFYHLPAMEDLNRTLTTFVPGKYSYAQMPALYYPALNASNVRVAKDPRTGTLAPTPYIGLFVPGSGNYFNGTAVGGKDGFPAGLYEPPWLSIGPRFGFAYDLFGNGKWALRAGIGVFRDRIEGNPTFGTNGQPPVAYTPSLSWGSLDTYAQAAGLLGPSNMNMLLGKQKPQTTVNYSFGIQHEIWKTNVDVSYVGGFSRNLLATLNINPIPIGGHFLAQFQDPTRPGNPLPDNFMRPYLGFGNLNYYFGGASSNYNSLQVSANRRFSRGLQFGVAYTRSKALGVADAFGSGVSPYFDWRHRNYGRLGFDRPNVFVANYVYDVPKIAERIFGSGFANGASGIPFRAILDNWEISGYTQFQTGNPFTPGFGQTAGLDWTGSTEGARVDIIGNPVLPKDQRTFDRWFNTSAFAMPARYTFGNAGVNVMNAPGINNWDMAVSKHIPIQGEQRYLQFRCEMFNVWNHTQFNAVSSGTNFCSSTAGCSGGFSYGQQTSASMGQLSGTRPPRQIALSLKLYF
jgi:hypothetical protein